MKRNLLIAFLFSSLISGAQNYTFLGDYTSDGTPLYLEKLGDQVSSASLEQIKNALPEGYPVPDYNPHYISSGYDTDITLTDDAEIWVTFVQEGAGYRNVLGFYTYEGGVPPASTPEPGDITIIFPNVSAVGSGGGLKSGDKVKLGSFSAGTSIGWVLLANGWNGSAVTPGNVQLFSNADYNPESSETLRQHNVLLYDDDSERIFLGFEDIRRDYNSCDNDFNDAIFYVTANPITAIQTNNLTDIKSATVVSSANDGGLESNGDLAGLIANRNFKRIVNNTSINLKSFQHEFDKTSLLTLKSGTTAESLENYIPQSGMYGTEIPFVSSPEDLIGITNAQKVFSVDYYSGENRIAAILATQTAGSVYDHTKVICDRLNGSSLEDVRTVIVKGHQIISTKIKRQSGSIENSISFSIKRNESRNELHSHWNTADYPAGDYFNFQIWGVSFSQVFALANQVIETFAAEKPLLNEHIENPVPDVFIKSGYYSNGKIHLNIINKTGADFARINGSIAYSESMEREPISETIKLSGNYSDSLSIYLGSLFDVGLSLSSAGSSKSDAIYLADGPWGLDYLATEAEINSFLVDNREPGYDFNSHQVERQPGVSGQIKGTVNLFRQVLPGNLSLNVSAFNALSFSVMSSHPIEIVLVTDDLENWDNRLRVKIPANSSWADYQVLFSDFVDGEGKKGEVKNINRIVFSVQGDYQGFTDFRLEIEHVAFIYHVATSVSQFQDFGQNQQVHNYPNPFQTVTYFVLPEQTERAVLKVYDLNGRLVDTQQLQNQSSENRIYYKAPGLNTGIYMYSLIDNKGADYRGKFIVSKN